MQLADFLSSPQNKKRGAIRQKTCQLPPNITSTTITKRAENFAEKINRAICSLTGVGGIQKHQPNTVLLTLLNSLQRSQKVVTSAPLQKVSAVQKTKCVFTAQAAIPVGESAV